MQGDWRWEVDPTNHLFHAQWTTNTQSTPISTSQDPPPSGPDPPCVYLLHVTLVNITGYATTSKWGFKAVRCGFGVETPPFNSITTYQWRTQTYHVCFHWEGLFLAWLGFGLKSWLVVWIKHNFNKIHVNQALPIVFGKGEITQSLEVKWFALFHMTTRWKETTKIVHNRPEVVQEKSNNNRK